MSSDSEILAAYEDELGPDPLVEIPLWSTRVGEGKFVFAYAPALRRPPSSTVVHVIPALSPDELAPEAVCGVKACLPQEDVGGSEHVCSGCSWQVTLMQRAGSADPAAVRRYVEAAAEDERAEREDPARRIHARTGRWYSWEAVNKARYRMERRGWITIVNPGRRRAKGRKPEGSVYDMRLDDETKARVLEGAPVDTPSGRGPGVSTYQPVFNTSHGSTAGQEPGDPFDGLLWGDIRDHDVPEAD